MRFRNIYSKKRKSMRFRNIYSKNEMAKFLCDKTIKEVNNGYQTIKGAISYLAMIKEFYGNLISQRTLISFGKAVRKGKVKEQPNSLEHIFN